MTGFTAQVREVAELQVVTVSDVIDQAGLEAWLPGAMARAFERAAGGALTADDLEYVERSGPDAGPPTETYWTDFGAAAPGDQVFDVGERIA